MGYHASDVPSIVSFLKINHGLYCAFFGQLVHWNHHYACYVYFGVLHR